MALGDNLMAAIPAFKQRLQAQQAQWASQQAGLGPAGQAYQQHLRDYWGRMLGGGGSPDTFVPDPNAAGGWQAGNPAFDAAQANWMGGQTTPPPPPPPPPVTAPPPGSPPPPGAPQGNPAYGPDGILNMADQYNPLLSPTDRQFLAGQGYVDAYKNYLANPTNPTFYQAANSAWQNAAAWKVPGVPAVFPQAAGSTGAVPGTGPGTVPTGTATNLIPGQPPASSAGGSATVPLGSGQAASPDAQFVIDPATGQRVYANDPRYNALVRASAGGGGKELGPAPTDPGLLAALATAPTPGTTAAPAGVSASGAASTPMNAFASAAPKSTQGVGQTARQFGSWGGGFSQGGYVEPLAERLRRVVAARAR